MLRGRPQGQPNLWKMMKGRSTILYLLRQWWHILAPAPCPLPKNVWFPLSKTRPPTKLSLFVPSLQQVFQTPASYRIISLELLGGWGEVWSYLRVGDTEFCCHLNQFLRQLDVILWTGDNRGPVQTHGWHENGQLCVLKAKTPKRVEVKKASDDGNQATSHCSNVSLWIGHIMQPKS